MIFHEYLLYRLLLPDYSKTRLFTPLHIIMYYKKLWLRIVTSHVHRHSTNINRITTILLCIITISHISHMIPYFSGKVLLAYYTYKGVHGCSSNAVIASTVVTWYSFWPIRNQCIFFFLVFFFWFKSILWILF